ncbi:galactosyltransferase domain-containing protein [Ditylenchus destructor]|uniref:Hexosyltransferase n=1 Tax=Ditylenchus destructor TaxID=166010 RepID=A0AAD4MMT8_9BILA|nr:galactosyltransferase domain-containing protein [Ditylenchus destructor]
MMYGFRFIFIVWLIIPVLSQYFNNDDKVVLDHDYKKSFLVKAQHPDFYKIPLRQLDQIGRGGYTGEQNWSLPHEFTLAYSNENWTFYVQEPSENTKKACKNAKILIVVYVVPERFAVRKAIRESWANNLADGIVLKFILGMRDNSTVNNMILEELQKNDDLILTTLSDTYRTLFLKVAASFHWHQTFCSSAQYFLKTDDDITVSVDRLQYWIDKRLDSFRKKDPAVIFGALWKGMKPERDTKNKYYASEEEWPLDIYLDFMSGSVYLLTDEAVKKIVATMGLVHTITLEDVLYTGIVAKEAGIKKIDASKVLFPMGQRAVNTPTEDCFDNVPLLSACNYFWNDLSQPKLHHKYLDDLVSLNCSKNECFYKCKEKHKNKEINFGAGQRLIDGSTSMSTMTSNNMPNATQENISQNTTPNNFISVFGFVIIVLSLYNI